MASHADRLGHDVGEALAAPLEDVRIDVTELVRLWTGDLWSCGYAHERIAYEILTRGGASTLGALKARLLSVQTDKELERMVRHAFERWEADGCPTV